jgi:penicillin-binding protein 2
LAFYTKRRFRIITYLIIAAVVALSVRLYFLQIIQGEIYAEEAVESILRTKTVSAPRGDIYDRNGKLLVKSVPVTGVAVEPRKVLQNEEVISILADKLGISEYTIKKKLQATDIPYTDRIILKQDIDNQTMIYISENLDKLPGVELIDTFIREYPFGQTAAHVLGYIGEIDEDKLLDERYSVGYEGGDMIGISGVEDYYEDILKGMKGSITYMVDPLGRPEEVVDESDYIPGNDLYLTLDIDLQKEVENILQESIFEIRTKIADKDIPDEYFKVPGGSVVVLDPRGNEVLAMASYPTYDPSVFTGGISVRDWEYLNDPENEYPLNNRALLSYACGSVFKIVTSYGGLNEGIIDRNSTRTCLGTWYGLGDDYPKSCWNKSGHGSLSIVNAIKHSCDIFFYEVGLGLYIKDSNEGELLQEYARLFGLGSETGIDLPSEDEGIVPDKAWKKEQFKGQIGMDIWFPGDTVNMAIGQGDLLVTPLQLALAYSVIANGGIKYTPHLAMQAKDSHGDIAVDYTDPEFSDLELKPDYVEMIEEGLELVTKSGTAAYRFVGFPLSEIPIAGKTGTAEVYGKQDFAWFASYAPIGDPEYVVVVMLEQAGGGSSSAAPIARQIYDYLYDMR